MSFITQADYLMLISSEDMELVKQSSDAIREKAESAAMDQAESYLSQRYDCHAIWTTEGEARNKMLVMVLIDLVLYHLHTHLPQRMGMEIRRQRYEDALAWLEAVAAGKITPELPQPSDETLQTPIKFNSNPKTYPYF